MVLKQLLALLLNRNSEKLVEQLADSYLMRRAAQIATSVFFRSKAIAEEHKLAQMIDKQKLQGFVDKFKKNIEEEIQKAKKELESKK